jgi:hypothetical protein
MLAVLAIFLCVHSASTYADASRCLLRFRYQPFRFTMESTPKPARAGQNITLHVHAIDLDSRPADGLMVEVFPHLTGEETKKEDAPRAVLHARGGGEYEGKVRLDSSGTWELDIVGRKKDAHSRQRVSLDVENAPAGAASDHRESWQAPGDDDE